MRILLIVISDRTQVTSLIHRHAEKFDSNAAVQMMTSGRNWPRSMRVASDVNFKHISNMLMGLDFRYQADVVALMREEEPNIDEICRLLRESKEECADLKEIITAIMQIARYSRCGTYIKPVLQILAHGCTPCLNMTSTAIVCYLGVCKEN